MMDYKIVDISSNEDSLARQRFCGSDFQRFLHNDLVTKLAEARVKLEEAEPDDVAKLQAAIRELKSVLSIIHGKDSQEVKKLYA